MYVTRTKQPTNVSNVDMVFTEQNADQGRLLYWDGLCIVAAIWFYIHGIPKIRRGLRTFVDSEDIDFTQDGTFVKAYLKCINVTRLHPD